MSSKNSSLPTTYRLAVVNCLPWIELQNDGSMRGAFTSVVRDLSSALNFNFEFVPSKDGGWGRRNPDGNWTGINGMLQRKEVDMYGIPVGASAQRMELLRFSSSPLYTAQIVIATGINERTDENLFGLINTFDLEVWLFILLSMFTLIITLVHIDRISAMIHEHTEEKYPTTSEYAWNIIAAFFSEATPRDPNRNLNRFLFMVWWLSVVTLMNAFTGQFKSTLTIRKEPRQINDIEDLAKATNMKIFVWKGSLLEDFIKKSQQESVKKIAKTVVSNDGFVRINKLYASENYHQIVTRRLGLLTECSTLKYFIGQMCDGGRGGNVYLSKESVMFINIYFGMGKHLPKSFAEKVDDRIYRYSESGLWWKWEYDMFKDYGKCVGVLDNEATEITLKFKDMRAVFVIWSMSILISTYGIIYETIKFKLNKT